MVKNMRRQHVHVLFEEKNVVCSMKIPPFNIFYDLFLNLARPIVPESSVVVVLKNKVGGQSQKTSKDCWIQRGDRIKSENAFSTFIYMLSVTDTWT